MPSPFLPQKNPALMPIIAELKAIRLECSVTLIALEELEVEFGGLPEGAYNAWDNAEHKFNQASEALCELGIIAGPWSRDETED